MEWWEARTLLLTGCCPPGSSKGKRKKRISQSLIKRFPFQGQGKVKTLPKWILIIFLSELTFGSMSRSSLASSTSPHLSTTSLTHPRYISIFAFRSVSVLPLVILSTIYLFPNVFKDERRRKRMKKENISSLWEKEEEEKTSNCLGKPVGQT